MESQSMRKTSFTIWCDDLVLSRNDFTLMEKFVALFKPIKRMADLLNGDGFKKDKVIGDTARYLSKEFDEYFR